MFSLIFFGLFMFFGLIAMLIGMLKGRKYKWQIPTTRIVMVVAATLIAMLLAAIVSYLVAMLLFAVLGGLLTSLPYVKTLFDTIPSISAVAKAFVAMILAPTFFFIFFFIARGVLYRFDGRIVKLISKMLGKDGKKEEAVSAEAVAEDTSSEFEINVAEEGVSDEAEAAESVAEEVVTTEDKPRKLTRKEKKNLRKSAYRSDKKFDAVGALCGAACGFLVYIVLLMPIVGALTPINGIAQTVLSKSDDGIMAVISDIADATVENPGAKTVKVLGGDLVYSGLTTYPINGKLTSMSRELKVLTDVGEVVTDALGDTDDKAKSADNLRAVSDTVGKSRMVTMLLSDFLSAASTEWSEGETFCGISAPGASGTLGDLLTDVYVIMKDSDYDTISGDIKTIVYSVALFVEHDAVGSLTGGGGTLDIFEDEELISGVMLELFENDRMAPLVGSITNMGISLMSDNLEISSKEDLYDDFVYDMKAAYDVNGTNVKELSAAIAEVYDDHGIEISAGVAECVALSMIQNVRVTDIETISDFFTDAGSPVGNVSANGAPITSLATSGNANAITVVDRIIASGATDVESLKEAVKTEFKDACANMSEEDFDKFAAELASKLYAGISANELKYGNALVANQAEIEENTLLVTEDQLEVVYVNIADKESEAKAIAHIFASAIAVVDDISNGNGEIDDLVASFGPVLDAFTESQLMGKEYTAKFLVAMFQSESVRSKIGFTLVQATDIATSINDGVANDNEKENYASLMKSIGSTVNIIKISADNGDTTAAVQELMADITPASAATLQKLSTPEMVKQQGVPEQSAAPVSDMLSDMFGNMSTAKESGEMTESEYEKESKAVNDMLNIGMSATKSDEKSVFGENSSTGITATEFVERATDSKVISKTVVNSVYGDGEEANVNPLNSGKNLSEEEQTELVGALDAEWKAHLNDNNDPAANAEYAKVIVSVASVVNLEVSIIGNQVVIPAVAA